MKLLPRNFFSVVITGKRETLLSFYLQLMKDDLIWANNESIQPFLLSEIQQLLIENLDEIEKLAKTDNSSRQSSFLRLGGSQHLQATVRVRQGRIAETLLVEAKGENRAIVKSYYQPNFHLVIWIFQPDADQTRILSAEEL